MDRNNKPIIDKKQTPHERTMRMHTSHFDNVVHSTLVTTKDINHPKTTEIEAIITKEKMQCFCIGVLSTKPSISIIPLFYWL